MKIEIYEFDLLSAEQFDAHKKHAGLKLLEVSKNGATFAIVEILGYFKNGKMIYPKEIPQGFEKLIDIDNHNLITYTDKDALVMTEGCFMRRTNLMDVLEREKNFIGKSYVKKYLFVKYDVFNNLANGEFFFHKNKLWKIVMNSEDGRPGFACATSIEGKGMWKIRPQTPVLRIIEGKIHEKKMFTTKEQATIYLLINYLFEELEMSFLAEGIPESYEVYPLFDKRNMLFVPLENPPKQTHFTLIEASEYINKQTNKKDPLVITLKGIIMMESLAKTQPFPYRKIPEGVTIKLYKFNEPFILSALKKSYK